MNTPRMIGSDKGNGISMDIVRLIPKDTTIQNNCVSSNCLLLLPKLIVFLHSCYALYWYLIVNKWNNSKYTILLSFSKPHVKCNELQHFFASTRNTKHE